MNNNVREFINEQIMKIVEKTIDVEKERKREPEVGTKEYDDWLKIYYLGMWMACSQILEVAENASRK